MFEIKNKIFLFLLLTACSSTTKNNETESIKVQLPIAEKEQIKDAHIVKYLSHSNSEELKQVMDDVNTHLKGKYYKLSNFLPQPSFIKKDKAIVFQNLDNEIDLTEKVKKSLIQLSLAKDTKYDSYKLSIAYQTKTRRKKIKNRHWLFSSNMTKEQLRDSIIKTFIRFSFQTL